MKGGLANLSRHTGTSLQYSIHRFLLQHGIYMFLSIIRH